MKRTRTITWEDPMTGAKEAMQMDGVDYLQAMSDHKFPLPPLLHTLDFTVGLIEKGNVVFEFTPQEFHYNPIGTVHGGVITAILDSAMGCLVHSLLPAGKGYTGLEIAKQLTALDNHVIITGRNQERLDAAAASLQNITTILSDVSKAEDVDLLVARIKADFPQLNIVINNAGRAILYNLADSNQDAFANAEDEMLTNYLSIIRINQKLLPVLKVQRESAIVNVSSIVAYVPGVTLPTYAASKAALHSYSASLRLSLEETAVKVFELMPPLVDTEFSKEIGGHNGIKPSVVADDLLAALANDEFEIRVGDTAKIYELFRQSPVDALNVMNANRKAWIDSVEN
jgi:uncharacterized oxidoreductase